MFANRKDNLLKQSDKRWLASSLCLCKDERSQQSNREYDAVAGSRTS